MEIFIAWLILASVNLAATISPGPSFAITVRNAIAYDRRAGIFTALGLGLGVAVHVTLVLGGFAVLIAQSSFLYNFILYAGAAYLFYIGVKALQARKQKTPQNENEAISVQDKTISDYGAFRMGAIASLLNPKSMVFFIAIYAQFIAPHTPWQILGLYGLTSVLIEIVWFSGVAVLLTDSRIKHRFLGFAHWIERVCGGLLIAIAIKLALSRGLA
jgi:RhtB (resistance to homoserine/threonine) family protein